MKKLILPLALATAVIASPATAALTVNYDTSSTYSTTALTGYSTNGAMMDGMSVTAVFADGSSQTSAWVDTSSSSGSASGSNGWSLSLSGDSFTNNWSLSNQASSALSSVFIDAGVGNSVFDTQNNGASTAGSAAGHAFSLSGSSAFDIVATYSGLVALTGQAAVGDLFRYLSIDFTNNDFTGGLGFRADTDNLKFAGDIVDVPVPAPLALLGLGLVMIGLSRRKNNA